MLNDVTESKRKQSDGGDGVQEHGGGLDHAADGAGLIHQILDPPPSYVRSAGKLSFFAFYARLPTSWFLWPVDLLPST